MIDYYYKLYGERWRNASYHPWDKEYITNCTDPNEIRAIRYCFARLDDGYFEHCIICQCIDQLEKLEKEN